MDWWELEGSFKENPPLVMQPEAQLHVVGRQWREGCWNTGSLDEIPPLVMQLEAQLRVVRWEWDGREMECWEFEGNLPLAMQP